jgi:hypothetical protein
MARIKSWMMNLDNDTTGGGIESGRQWPPGTDNRIVKNLHRNRPMTCDHYNILFYFEMAKL